MNGGSLSIEVNVLATNGLMTRENLPEEDLPEAERLPAADPDRYVTIRCPHK
jgi:hypothetical protein